jgi:hypothetical protein
MKKYIFKLFIMLFTFAGVTSCTVEEGKEPGNDPNPVVTIYKYATSRPYNVDNDISLRFAVNNKTTDAYYIAEKTTDKESRIASSGEAGYMDYVVANGTKLSLTEESYADVILTDLYGEYTITAVAVGSGTKSSASTVFTGLDWETKATGTYTFKVRTAVTGTSAPTTLQVCTTDAKLYRFKDVFGAGYHMKIRLIDQTGSDSDGEYTFFRIPAQETPFTYSTYGTVNVRDIGYWQGSDAWITDNGYESGMYADYYCFIMIQYYVSAGNLGYNYEFFTPD